MFSERALEKFILQCIMEAYHTGEFQPIVWLGQKTVYFIEVEFKIKIRYSLEHFRQNHS